LLPVAVLFDFSSYTCPRLPNDLEKDMAQQDNQ